MDLIYEGGLREDALLHQRYGRVTANYSRGPRIITDETRAEMRRILEEIQSGKFAKEFILENMSGRSSFLAMRRRDANHQVEQVGAEMRGMMSWLNQDG